MGLGLRPQQLPHKSREDTATRPRWRPWMAARPWRLKLDWPYDRREFYNSWLLSPALNGLQELDIDSAYQPRHWKWNDKAALRPEIDRGYCRRNWDWYDTHTPELREMALFQFAPTLRLLSIGYHTFPSAAAVAALRLPHLELISFCCVDISEGALHGVLAGCPVLRTLVLNGCTGFAMVRINSPTITSFAVSPADTSTTISTDWEYDSDDNHYDHPRKIQTVRVTTSQVIIEDAPLLEKLLVLCRRSATAEPFRLLRVVRAPRLRVLGSLSSAIPMLQIGGTVFEPTTHRVNHVRPDSTVIIKEKRSLMQAVMLGTAVRTVKILALEDVDSVDFLTNFLKCFPCLEKLYISASRGFRSAASYDKQNPLECLEHHLKMVALDGYDGKITHVRVAKFFVRNARLLELMKFRIFRNHHCEPGTTKEWIADQQRQLQVRSMASRHVKFHFVHDARHYEDVHCGEDISDLSEYIHDSSRVDPFDQWFESEMQGLAC